MVCSMVKKAVLGAALSAGALYLTFGTHAPSYVRTAFCKFRNDAKGAVPVQFEIDRARQEIANLEPAIKDNIEVLARAEVDVEYLNREIANNQARLANEQKEMLALRERLESGDFRLAGRGHVSYTAEEVKGELGRRLDRYRQATQTLAEKEATLKAREQSVVAARKLLMAMADQKKTLLSKLEKIEAHLKMIEATKASNEFDFDDSALARAKQSVSDLEKRLEVLDRKTEMEGQFVDTGNIPISTDLHRDVVKELDEEFGTAAAPKAENGSIKDKSL
jgi:DNA repair exonuclease SbcCD ATPase subunit